MKHASAPQAISWFREHYIGGRLTLRPPFQRKPVWTDKQRCSLVESILLDIPIPEVYVQVTQDDEGSATYGVVDGQQRLRTILQFVGLENEADQGVGESMPSVMEELRRLAQNERSEDSDLRDSAHLAQTRLTANRFYRDQGMEFHHEVHEEHEEVRREKNDGRARKCFSCRPSLLLRGLRELGGENN